MTNVEKVRRVYEAAAQDGLRAALAQLDDLADPEIEFSPLLVRELEGRVLRGRDEVRGFFLDLDETLDGPRYEYAEAEEVVPDVVLAAIRLIGSGRTSAVPVDQELFLVFEFAAGRVRRITAWSSREDAMTAVGKAAHA